jgi:serine/threonine protein kinase
LRRLKHKNIVNIVESYEVGDRLFALIMEPVGNCNLLEWMYRAGDLNFPQAYLKMISGWCENLVDVLRYIHGNDVRHRDIKPQNILVRGTDILLMDFGSCRELVSGLDSSTIGSASGFTPLYAAPEMVARDKRGKAADIFSMGCVFCELVTILGKRSLKDFAEYRRDPKLNSTAFRISLPLVELWIQDLQLTEFVDRAFLISMLNKTPQHRPSAREMYEKQFSQPKSGNAQLAVTSQKIFGDLNLCPSDGDRNLEIIPVEGPVDAEQRNSEVLERIPDASTSIANRFSKHHCLYRRPRCPNHRDAYGRHEQNKNTFNLWNEMIKRRSEIRLFEMLYLHIRAHGAYEISSAREALLRQAAFHGDLRVVSYLLQTSETAPTDKSEARIQIFQALELASAQGHIDVVQRILDWLKERNDPAMKQRLLTSLRAALSTSKCNAEVVELLLDKLDTEKPPDLLHDAVESSCYCTVYLLLSRGADIDAGLPDTALMRAIKTQKVDMVDLLLTFDADVNIVDHQGLTPLSEAKRMEGLNRNASGTAARRIIELIQAKLDEHIDRHDVPEHHTITPATLETDTTSPLRIMRKVHNHDNIPVSSILAPPLQTQKSRPRVPVAHYEIASAFSDMRRPPYSQSTVITEYGPPPMPLPRRHM